MNGSDLIGIGPTEKAARPRIGITTYLQPAQWGVWQESAALLSDTYINCIIAAGGTPLMLPPAGTDVSIVEDLDGLIIAGGSDVDAQRYGSEAHPLTQPQSHRDDHDFALTQAALHHGLPLFAICRGLQVLNVLRGGSLIQHLPEVVDSKTYQPAPGEFGRIPVTTDPGSRVASLLGQRPEVSVYHHQAVDRIGAGLKVTARSDDGVIQALELTDEAQSQFPGWMLAVQWHPERRIEDLRLFRGFTEAAHQHRERSGRA